MTFPSIPPRHAVESAIAAQGEGLINKHQVRTLILAARQTWETLRRFTGEEASFDQWRKGALHDICCRTSYRDVRQCEYAAALAYFGRRGSASGEAAASAADKRRRALWRLNQECHAAADLFGSAAGASRYAESLLRTIHHTDRMSASARQIWQVTFTLRNRAAAKRRQQAAQEAAGAAAAPTAPTPAPTGEKRFPAFSRGVTGIYGTHSHDTP